ncbi:MAG: pirin family protein [Alphaproteobacteria bacterium]
MIKVRRSDERGHANFGWLDSRHSFSFGHYRDPAHMGFSDLRVINEDRVAPGAGFDMHPHRDMEIVTWVLEGALAHRDSLGNGSVIRPGDVQRMTAGTGILHSEHNASDKEPVHLLQIWILPDRTGLAPGYEEKRFAPEDLAGRLRLVAARDGRDGAVTIHQDAELHIGRLEAGDAVTHALAPGRTAWVQVARGAVAVGGVALAQGDAAAVTGESGLDIAADAAAEVLLFDLAA